MKTFISNKWLSSDSPEIKRLEKIDRDNRRGYKEPKQEGPFNTQMADALKKIFKIKEPKTYWNVQHLAKD